MRTLILFGLVLATALAGCSQGNPVAPSQLQTTDSIGGSNRVLWGIWNVAIDNGSVSFTPLRGAQFTCNVTQFMQKPISPVNMLSIEILPGSEPANGYFEVRVTLRHPFPGLSMYNGFDVRGIFMANGSVVGNHDSSVLRAGPDDSRLLNADGYTRWWNWSEFTSYNTIFGFTPGKLAPPNHPTSTVNPYRYFAEGLDELSPPTTIDMATRGFFSTSPGVHSRQYNIQFRMNGSDPVFDFQYAVDASWAPPDPSYAPSYPQDAFTLSANCQEAFAISVSDAGSTAYYVSPSENGGQLSLRIEVYDWQSVSNPNGTPGEVAGIWLEGPILGGAYDVLSSATILPGSSSVSSVYEVSIGSLDLTKSGPETLFLTVESAWPNTYEPQVAGGAKFNYPPAPLAAFHEFSVNILDHSPAVDPPVAIAAFDPAYQQTGKQVHFYDNGSYDPGGGTIVSYQWDWENDGVFDQSGKDLYHSWPAPGDYEVQFKVTSSTGLSDTLDSPLLVHIISYGKIAWVSFRDGNPEIYRMQGDGTAQTRLTFSSDHDWEPAWSPDGKKIAWRAGGYSGANIWIMNEDGSGKTQITFNGNNFDPEWDPNGEWIYFWSWNGGNGGTNLWKVRPDGSGQQQVTFFSNHTVTSPNVSPDNQYIVYEGGSVPRDIYRVNINGSNQTNLTSTPSYWDAYPVFNLTGDKICFTTDQAGPYKLFSIKPDGTGLQQVSYPPAGQFDFMGCFGVNDEWLVVWRRTGASSNNDEIGRYVVATKEFIQFTNDLVADQYPDWHPLE